LGSRLAKFTLLRRFADFLTYKIRSVLLLAVVVLSIVPGTIYFSWPASAKLAFAYAYTGIVEAAFVSQVSFFVNFAETAIGSVIFGRRYNPAPYSTPEITALAKKMGVLGKVKVHVTSNPWIKGPFTNALTGAVYVPLRWIESRPKSEIVSVIAHEFGHITKRRRFGLEVVLVFGFVFAFTFFLSLFTIWQIYLFAELSLTLLLISRVSRRGEYRADMEGAIAAGPEGLISVFEWLKTELRRDDGSETHPPLWKRIRKLEPLLDKDELHE
jgi:Zn-dependent protease with chaperone function